MTHGFEIEFLGIRIEFIQNQVHWRSTLQVVEVNPVARFRHDGVLGKIEKRIDGKKETVFPC
jgi:hypothetical protein